MPAPTTAPKTRNKPAPDILRDARRVRDILGAHSPDNRDALIKLALAALAPPASVTP